VRRDVTAAEALQLILERTPVLGAETVALPEALGRVLAEPIASTRRIPPADNSAMDGYAVRIADLAATQSAPVRLPVAFEIAAGARAERALAAGESARIFTGAPIPPGADAVVRQEDVERDGERVAFTRVPLARENIRPAGEDVEVGDAVFAAGERIGPAHVGMLASLGRGFVPVRQRPRVAILSGGDELVEPDGDVAGGRIVSSNSYTIAAQCRELGAEPVYLGIARDAPEDIESRLAAGLASDVLVSSAGVSVGDRDYVRSVLEKLGCRLHFWGVRIKPGYPLAFGSFGDDVGRRGPLVFGLPGNPVSAMMTFEQFTRPALRKLLGHATLHRPSLRARLAEPLRKAPGRLHFVRVALSRDGERVIARPTGSQSSGVLRSMTLAQGLLVFPAEATELAEGDEVRVQVLDESFLDADDAGY
jgi:molybdopterin molybdotransferase